MDFGTEKIQYVKDRKGHDRRYALDCTKINNLNWSPKFSFENALKLKLASNDREIIIKYFKKFS